MDRIIKFKNGSEITIPVDEDGDDLDKIKGVWTFREFYDYLLRTGQIPHNEFDFDWDGEWEMMKKVLMPKLNLKEHKIIILETPTKKSGFFYDMWKKSKK